MEITNTRIIDYLQLILNKNINKISTSELDNLEKIVIDSKGLSQEEAEKNIIIIFESLSSLKEITFINTCITKRIMTSLRKKEISKIYIKQCAFETEDDIKFPNTIEMLIMYRCFMDNYDMFLKNLPVSLKYLEINAPIDENMIKCNMLNKLSSLEILILSGCIVDFSEINLPQCKVLQLLNTMVKPDDIKNISKLKNLEMIFISKPFVHGEQINELRKRVKIKTDLSEYLFDDYEDMGVKNK